MLIRNIQKNNSKRETAMAKAEQEAYVMQDQVKSILYQFQHEFGHVLGVI